MRTFLAIKVKLYPQILETINLLKEELVNENIKWVDTNVLHLTLKFLGEINELQVQQISESLSTFTTNAHQFSIELEGLGYFKSNRNPRVLFLNIRKHDYLNQLISDIENELFPFGFEKENKAFVPHLTIARIKHLNDKNQFYTLIEKHNDQVSQIVDVKEIILYRSKLNATGPIYKELVLFPLHSN